MGRPKLFDRTEVLERALDVFWEFGYHEASMRRLAAAMDINVATIFSEFGDKKGLYAHALENYETLKLPLFIGALERPGADLQTVLLNEARLLAVNTLGLFVMIRAKVAPEIVHDTVEGTIATLLSALETASVADTAPHDRSITPGIAGSTSANRKGLAP
jgi:AcrR family transcriptional regulator